MEIYTSESMLLAINKRKCVHIEFTFATNKGCNSNLSRKELAISEVCDLEAIATSTPLSFRAYRMPLA